MSADTLRQAATSLREECYAVRRPYGPDEHLKLAVAAWLDGEAENWGDLSHMISPHALAVARAAMGGGA